MSIKVIAERYAIAFLAEAVAQGKTEVAEKDLDKVSDVLDSSSDLRMLFRSPIIETWRKKKIIREVFKDEISDLTMNFLLLVFDKGRERLSREVISEFRRKLDAQRRILRVRVESATELDKDSRSSLAKGISERSGGMNVESTYDLLPDLLGGVRVTIGDKVYDGSLRHQLDALRDRLASA
jgi:F-type H+-transporting ATPase subunit delta